jgi:hypothetical protein
MENRLIFLYHHVGVINDGGRRRLGHPGAWMSWGKPVGVLREIRRAPRGKER